MVVNNPESNMGNAIGICPVIQLYKRGILLVMGTDAYTNDMLESLKVALCSQRSQNCLAQRRLVRGHGYALQEQRQDRREVLPRHAGRIEGRAAADIIVMDYKPYTPFSDENIDGHMIFGMTGRQCQTTIAAGRHSCWIVSWWASTRRRKCPHSGGLQELWGDLNHKSTKPKYYQELYHEV